MTNPNNTEQHESDGAKAFDRRTILRGATALAATAMAASDAAARDFGRNASALSSLRKQGPITTSVDCVRSWGSSFSSQDRSWLWVPAFAGTTL